MCICRSTADVLLLELAEPVAKGIYLKQTFRTNGFHSAKRQKIRSKTMYFLSNLDKNGVSSHRHKLLERGHTHKKSATETAVNERAIDRKRLLAY